MMATEKAGERDFGHWLDSQSFICHFTQQLNTKSIFSCLSRPSLAITRFNILKRCYETQWNRLYNAPSGRAWMNIIPKRQHRGRQKKVNIRKGEADFSSLLPPKQQAAVIISRCLCSFLAVLNFHPSGFFSSFFVQLVTVADPLVSISFKFISLLWESGFVQSVLEWKPSR